MHLLFEEGGDLKVATALSQQGESWQVDTPGGRRIKIKARDVLLQFAQPAAGELLSLAQALVGDIDLGFLWECAPEQEFGFAELAVEYFGKGADVVQQTALALALQGAPVYFRRKGRGRFQRAPEDQLKAALIAVERKQQHALLQQRYVDDLKANQLPEAFRGKVMQLLFKPDKNTLEYKALDAACTALSTTPMRLMVACGGIESPRALHEARFMAAHFPAGIAFPDLPVPAPSIPLPLADVQAFSIDDVATTEIDDAFSVAAVGTDAWRIGIHIAAPALGLKRGDALDHIARDRLSTVYFPGDKITMLPDPVIDTYTLRAGAECPAVSLYVTVNATTWDVIKHETRVERITVAHNLRHNLLDDQVTEAHLASGEGDYPCKDAIAVLWPFVNQLYAQRQAARAQSGLRPESNNRPDYSFYIDQEDGVERVRIEPRHRGAPLDKIVAELMILANSTWGGMLAETGVPAIYRTQRATGLVRTRMQTTPGAHEGLGVKQYTWSTSPLRRYIDLVNQWQIIAVAQHGVSAKLVAPFKPGEAELFAVAADFEATYAGYGEHQSAMETYWCLRWLKQEQRSRVQGTVLREGNVRLAEVPLVIKVAELMGAPRGTHALLEIRSIDEIALTATCQLISIVDTQVSDAELAADDAEMAERLKDASAEDVPNQQAVGEAQDLQVPAAHASEAVSSASSGDRMSTSPQVEQPLA